jgi:uncharacterized protein (DUF305 family)
MSITGRCTCAVGGGALVLTLVLTLSACGGSAAPAGSAGAGDAPDTVVDASAQYNGADVRFAQMMVPHHQQALEMVEIALERTQNTEVRALAGEIRAKHDPQLTTLTGFLESWGAAPADDGMAGMDHSGMSGMMGQADMETLAHASGAAFDAMFLEMMIVHHEGAVADAQRAVAEGANTQVKELATQIVSDQSAEIERIRQLLQ